MVFSLWQQIDRMDQEQLLPSVVTYDGAHTWGTYKHGQVSAKWISAVYLDVPLLVNQQVFRFQVSVDQVQSVQILEGQDDLSCIKPSMWLTAHTQKKDRQQFLGCLTAYKPVTGKQESQLTKNTLHTHLNLPILRRWENISPPGTYSITM